MSGTFEVHTVTINISAFVTETLKVAGGQYVSGVLFPVITSAQVYAQGAAEDVAGSYWRLFRTDGTTTWAYGAGPGSNGVSLWDVAAGFPFLRFETSIAQAASRAVIVVTKPR